jgi:hypothetical protein
LVIKIVSKSNLLLKTYSKFANSFPSAMPKEVATCLKTLQEDSKNVLPKIGKQAQSSKLS